VSVRVDETRRYDLPFGVDLFFSRSQILANDGDVFTVHGYIGLKSRASGTIDDQTVSDY
jgi:hypothetical protein